MIPEVGAMPGIVAPPHQHLLSSPLSALDLNRSGAFLFPQAAILCHSSEAGPDRELLLDLVPSPRPEGGPALTFWAVCEGG